MTPLLTHWSLGTRTLKCHSSCSLKFHWIFALSPGGHISPPPFFGIRIHKSAEIRVSSWEKPIPHMGSNRSHLGVTVSKATPVFTFWVLSPSILPTRDTELLLSFFLFSMYIVSLHSCKYCPQVYTSVMPLTGSFLSY